MWPLDSAMGATAAHRAPEKVADGTCTWVWAWMIDKCRKKMNGGAEYITIEILQNEGEGGRRGPRKRREALGMREELGILVFGRGVPSLWDLGPSDPVRFSPLRTSRRLIRAKLLDPLSTNSLWWAWSENRDPTIGAVCGEVTRATMSAIAC